MPESSSKKTGIPNQLKGPKDDAARLRTQLAAELDQIASGSGSIAALEDCVQQLEAVTGDSARSDPEAALAEFHKKHAAMMLEPKAGPLPEPRRKRPKLAVLIVAAVAFVTATFAGASDLGITKMIAHWTEETFHFAGSGGPPETEEGSATEEGPVEGAYATVEEALAACEISEAAFPKWLPEDASLDTVAVYKVEGWCLTFSADYVREGNAGNFFVEIKKYVRIEDAHTIQFEKDDNPVLEYKVGDTIHYLFGNLAGDVATWIQEDMVCMIVGDLTKEEFIKMIDSIYEE